MLPNQLELFVEYWCPEQLCLKFGTFKYSKGTSLVYDTPDNYQRSFDQLDSSRRVFYYVFGSIMATRPASWRVSRIFRENNHEQRITTT